MKNKTPRDRGSGQNSKDKIGRNLKSGRKKVKKRKKL
jgi:hypothetical protein